MKTAHIGTKQRAIMSALQEHGQLTVQELIRQPGCGAYHNAHKHIQPPLRGLINRGLVIRVSRGVYELAHKVNDQMGLEHELPPQKPIGGLFEQ